MTPTQPPTSTPHDYTVSNIAALFRTNVHSVYGLIKTGQLGHYKVGARGTRITQAQLDRFRNSGGAVNPDT